MRNINVAYILAFSKNTWFWLGVWIFYYLRFTDYAGIGLIETTLILTLTLAEIPTGAIADLLGKRLTLIIAFLLETIGAVVMATAFNLPMLIISVFIMCIGGAFYSGTIDALVYDSLKEKGLESSYGKKISNINTISLIAPAICSIIGGYLYLLSPTLPFWMNALGYFVGLIAAFFLIEPKIDTVRFSLASFFEQSTTGLKELFKSRKTKFGTLFLLSIGFFIVITSEMLDSFLSFEFGYSEVQMGMLWAIIFLISAFASQLTPYFLKYVKGNSAVLLTGIFIALTLIISPKLGLILGGISLTLRASFQGIYGNLSSIIVNENTESKYRATTLSTFNMIKNMPYVISAYFIGSLSDTISAKSTSLVMGILLLTIMSVFFVFNNRSNKLNLSQGKTS